VTAVLATEKAVTSVQLRVATTQLDCKNDKMNEHMLKALKSKEFADITFALETYTLARAAEGASVSLKGNLTLGGVTRPVTIEATANAGPDGALRIAGNYQLHMTEYGLQPPKLMLGALKVNELVNVNFDLLLKP
jgi:polyisoprenoid-binding protein YceI